MDDVEKTPLVTPAVADTHVPPWTRGHASLAVAIVLEVGGTVCMRLVRPGKDWWRIPAYVLYGVFFASLIVEHVPLTVAYATLSAMGTAMSRSSALPTLETCSTPTRSLPSSPSSPAPASCIAEFMGPSMSNVPRPPRGHRLRACPHRTRLSRRWPRPVRHGGTR